MLRDQKPARKYEIHDRSLSSACRRPGVVRVPPTAGWMPQSIRVAAMGRRSTATFASGAHSGTATPALHSSFSTRISHGRMAVPKITSPTVLRHRRTCSLICPNWANKFFAIPSAFQRALARRWRGLPKRCAPQRPFAQANIKSRSPWCDFDIRRALTRGKMVCDLAKTLRRCRPARRTEPHANQTRLTMLDTDRAREGRTAHGSVRPGSAHDRCWLCCTHRHALPVEA